jgi:hypothetical protein
MRIQLILASLIVALTPFAASAAPDVAEGQWINLFDQETTFGWTNFGDVEWTVKNKTMKYDQDKGRNGILTSVNGTGGMLATTSPFSNFELTARIRVSPGASTGLVYRAALAGHPTENGSSIVWLSTDEKAEAVFKEVRVIANGESVTVTVDGKKPEDVKLYGETHAGSVVGKNAAGFIGILYHHNKDAVVEVAEVKLRPLALSSVFNGKNLDGWNILPDHASKFSVIDGALNIKDGNGQIETAEVYKDFVLQIDVIANGKELNSGVFVRGPVGVFWKGYESQLRNHWQGTFRTKPVDYGTGGNYGNQYSRIVIPTDGEWFTKTVVINSNHMSVWINGYQTSDFYDNRVISGRSDGKYGYVSEAGTIHLQGHDPTTDLSFKNINVQKN